MIDLSTENLLSLSEAAGKLPRRRRGKKPNVSTLYRWTQTGCRGVVLESCQIGGTRCTSAEALQRFVDRLTSACGPNPPSSGRTPIRRRRDHARALAELDKALS